MGPGRPQPSQGHLAGSRSSDKSSTNSPGPFPDLGDSDNPIPLPNVSSQVLKKVLEWCEHHKKDPEPVADDTEETRKKTTEISDWDQKCKLDSKLATLRRRWGQGWLPNGRTEPRGTPLAGWAIATRFKPG